MKPGRLEPSFDPLPSLKRIGPSRIRSFMECGLKEIFSGARASALLPGSPAARLGTVAHRVIEKAGKGEVGSSEELVATWDGELSIAENDLRSVWFERHLAPLSRSVPMYEVRRLQTLKLAESLLSRPRHPSSGGSSSRASFERWVESKDGLVGGRIDQIVYDGPSVTIRDFKTGSLTLPKGEVKEEYSLQMKAYAALYFDVEGTWPTKLELVPLQGEVVPVPFTQEESLKVVAEAASRVREINSALTVSAKNEGQFAQPGVGCFQCHYRPRCTAYLEKCSGLKSEYGFRDLVGKLVAIKKFGNGTLGLEIETPEPLRVIGLSCDPSRHPGLSDLAEGSDVLAFNVQAKAASQTFSETEYTTIYQR